MKEKRKKVLEGERERAIKIGTASEERKDSKREGEREGRGEKIERETERVKRGNIEIAGEGERKGVKE